MQEDISNILERNLARKGLLKAAYSARVCAIAKEVGAGEFEPVSHKDGALKILVSDSSRAHLLKIKEPQLIEQINSKLGQKVVKRLVFKID